MKANKLEWGLSVDWIMLVTVVNIMFYVHRSSRRSSLEQLESHCTLSPESTAKTTDSGIECIATRLSEDGAALEVSPRDTDSPSSSVTTPASTSCTTRNAQVDQALIWHLAYCDRLFEVSKKKNERLKRHDTFCSWSRGHGFEPHDLWIMNRTFHASEMLVLTT